MDGLTFREATAALVRAHEMGLDPVEELNRVGLLLTSAQRKGIQVRAMAFIRDELASWRPAEMIRTKYLASRQVTPEDMYNCIFEWIQKHVSAVKEQQP